MKPRTIIAVVMPKGGTGKSTLATNLAVAALQDGWTPLILDTDPQVSSCNWADRRGKNNPPYVQDTMPARLRQTIEKAESMGANLFIIDTPPLSGEAGLAAARLADVILTPCGTKQKDIEALDKFKEIWTQAGKPESLVILNGVAHLSYTRQEWAREEISKRGLITCARGLTALVAFDDADKVGLSVLEYQPEGRAAEDIRLVYKQVSQLIDKLISKEEGNGELQSRGTV
jgi:chromosome partitioning protein